LPFEEAKKAESMRRSIARFSCFSCSFFDICKNSKVRSIIVSDKIEYQFWPREMSK
jgi:hypothetical protein